MCTLGSVDNQFLTFSMVFALSLCARSAFCQEEGRQGADAVRIEDVEFKNGDLTLHGNLYLPKKPGKYPALIVYHSASGGIRAYPTYQHLADVLPAKGVAVLLFDRRGFGQSQGNFETANFADLASDGIAGIRYLKGRKDIDSRHIGVWGVSQGGWIAPLASVMSKDIAFVIAVSGPGVTPAEQMDYAAAYALREAGYSEQIIKEALAIRASVNAYFRGRLPADQVNQAIAKARTQPWFKLISLSDGLPLDPKVTKWYQEMDFDPIPTLRKIKTPTLFFFGERDRWVPIEESISRIKEATRAIPNSEIHRIKGADHLMSTGKTELSGPISQEYVKLMLEWIQDQIKR
jgi:pimeloyl-ACP methyl ester carboxylesterase